MNLHQLYKKQVEAWKERLGELLRDYGRGYYWEQEGWTEEHDKLLPEAERAINSFISSSRHKDTIELIEAEIKRKEKMKKEEWDEVLCDKCGKAYGSSRNKENTAYNSAIEEDIAYLEEELRKFKNEQ